MLEQQLASSMHEAYIAGFIDAAGTIGVRNGKEQVQPYIIVRHKSINFIKQISNTFGFGKPFHYGGRYYACQCFGLQTVYEVLLSCIDHLMYRRKVAELVLKFCKSRLDNSYQPLTVGELKLVQEIGREVKKK